MQPERARTRCRFFLGCPRVYDAIIHTFLFALHFCQNFEDYLERMSVDGTWGDNLTLQVHLLPCPRPPPITLPFPYTPCDLARPLSQRSPHAG
jgi:hypothetical protein